MLTQQSVRLRLSLLPLQVVPALPVLLPRVLLTAPRPQQQPALRWVLRR